MKVKIGDRFAKKGGAGFVAQALPLCLVPDLEENKDPQPCLLCDDLDCLEYPTCYVLDASGTPVGVLYHVSECQMLPIR